MVLSSSENDYLLFDQILDNCELIANSVNKFLSDNNSFGESQKSKVKKQLFN